jgi:hypothetical protein
MPKIAIQCAILDRLQEMRRKDTLPAGQIGNRAGNLEDAMISSGAQMKFLHGAMEEFFAFRFQLAVSLEETVGHLRVRAAFCSSGEAFMLELRAARTRSRMASDTSARSSLLSSFYSTAGASTWMSMRSSNGPEMRLR